MVYLHTRTTTDRRGRETSSTGQGQIIWAFKPPLRACCPQGLLSVSDFRRAVSGVKVDKGDRINAPRDGSEQPWSGFGNASCSFMHSHFCLRRQPQQDIVHSLYFHGFILHRQKGRELQEGSESAFLSKEVCAPRSLPSNTEMSTQDR